MLHKEMEFIPIEIINFFQLESVNNVAKVKTVMDFCIYYHDKYKTSSFPQPSEIAKYSDILCDNGLLSLLYRGGMNHDGDRYLCMPQKTFTQNFKNKIFFDLKNKQLTYLIFGFKYIYEDYKSYVLPVEYTFHDKRISLGTCFLFQGGIGTAKHCIEGAKSISIQGIKGEDLKNARFEISSNLNIDLVFIRFKQEHQNGIYFYKSAELLDEVLTMGYPKIAGFHNYLTAEKAHISSRITASIGQVSSKARDIWINEALYLITAKIKGGNSGGPVITKDGNVCGIAVNLSEGEGDYDNLGYGTVIPITFLNEIINSTKKNYLSVSEIEFKDFPK